MFVTIFIAVVFLILLGIIFKQCVAIKELEEGIEYTNHLMNQATVTLNKVTKANIDYVDVLLKARTGKLSYEEKKEIDAVLTKWGKEWL